MWDCCVRLRSLALLKPKLLHLTPASKMLTFSRECKNSSYLPHCIRLTKASYISLSLSFVGHKNFHLFRYLNESIVAYEGDGDRCSQCWKWLEWEYHSGSNVFQAHLEWIVSMPRKGSKMGHRRFLLFCGCEGLRSQLSSSILCAFSLIRLQFVKFSRLDHNQVTTEPYAPTVALNEQNVCFFSEKRYLNGCLRDRWRDPCLTRPNIE